MITVLLSYLLILVSAGIMGYIVVHTLYKNASAIHSWDCYIMCGVAVLTVYAEYFSLVYKVGVLACAVLVLLTIVLWGIFAVRTKDLIVPGVMKAIRGISGEQVVIGLFIIGLVTFWNCDFVSHSDTPLYHMQALRWIEEYGVVPGLGNLHNRFAYNSAFLPLQALFSLNWLSEKVDLHTVNGFLCIVFSLYASTAFANVKKGKIGISDLFKLSFFVYIGTYYYHISSLSTDTFPMLLVIYMCSKWSELIEEKNEDPYPYAFICMLGIFSVSLKLSCVICVLLIIYPVTVFLREKRWIPVLSHFVSGIMIVFPWLARNVIISGYLLYPYYKFDFFDVDWKMLPSVAEYDKMEIVVYARGNSDVSRYGETIGKWFGEWFPWSNVYIYLCTVAVIGLAIIVLLKGKNSVKRNFPLVVLSCFSVATLVFWIFSAPLMRYGMVFILLPTCIFVGILLETEWGNCLRKAAFIRIMAIVLLLIWGAPMVANCPMVNRNTILFQRDYDWYATREIEVDEALTVWVPEKNTESSVDVFPCVPYPNMVSKLELRGEGYRDGFRIAQEHKTDHINEYGAKW